MNKRLLEKMSKKAKKMIENEAEEYEHVLIYLNAKLMQEIEMKKYGALSRVLLDIAKKAMLYEKAEFEFEKLLHAQNDKIENLLIGRREEKDELEEIMQETIILGFSL